MKKRMKAKKIKQMEIMISTAMYTARFGFNIKLTGHDSRSRFARRLLRRRHLSSKIGKWLNRNNVKISIGGSDDTK